MALSFAHGATDYVNHGSDATLDNLDPVTIMAWVNVDALHVTERNLFYNKASAADEGLSLYVGHTSGANIIQLLRETSGAWPNASAPIANFSAWGIGKWIFVAAVAEIGVAPRLLVGDLDTAPAEPSAYTAQVAGGGVVTSDAGQNAIVANGRGIAATWRFGGDVAHVHVAADNLSNAEIIQYWRNLSNRSTTRLNNHYGFNALGTQRDLSGNGNDGTLNNTALADHVPLGPFFGWDAWLPYIVSAPPVTNAPMTPWGGTWGIPTV